jgi:hypothetical protein
LPLKTDIDQPCREVRFVPKADIGLLTHGTTQRTSKTAKCHYPRRLAGSPRVPITVGSFKIQTGFHDHFAIMGTPDRSTLLSAFGGMRKAKHFNRGMTWKIDL